MQIPIEVLRNLVLRYGCQAGMKRDHVLVVWHLLDHAFTGQSYIFPGLKTLVKRLGVPITDAKFAEANALRTVRRWIQELQADHLISIQHLTGQSNRYRYHGVIKKMLPFWEAELDIAKKRKVKKSNSAQLNLLPGGGQHSPPRRSTQPSGGGQQRPPNSLNNSSRKVVSNVTHGTPLNNQPEKLETNEQIIAHLRQLASSGNGEADPASKTLMLLELLWDVNARLEIKKSWAWFQICARQHPQAFDRALGELKQRMSPASSLKPLRAPGAYFTTLVKAYAGIA